ncbi:MAG: tyrosine-type recombinase/integrase [Pseudomonadota bacterium]
MRVNRFKFTKSALDALPIPAEGARAVYHDTEAKGLQLRITSSGIKTFSIFRRVKGGQPERVTLGRFPELTVEKARAQAADINAAIENRANPAAVRRAHKAELTFGELFTDYLKRHSKPKKRTAAEDEAKYGQYLARPLGGRKLSEISRREIAAIHSKITNDGHPTTANRVLALVSSVYGWARSAGLWDDNPAKGIKRNAEKKRDRFLQADELPRFFAALAAEPNETIRDYFLVSLLTGARRANVLSMRWRDVSFERAEWRIPRTKNNDPQTVPLSAEAVAILEARKPKDRQEFVFPGPGERGHLVEPKKGWERVLERAQAAGLLQALSQKAGWKLEQLNAAWALAIVSPKAALKRFALDAKEHGLAPEDFALEDLRIHDLRRTLGSWQAKTGASLTIIGKSLNHKTPNTTAIYARLDLDPVRESVSRATAAMFAAGGAKESAAVLPFKADESRAAG